MRRLIRPLAWLSVPALFALLGLNSCEDDPILAPNKGSKESNGSYGNIAVAPPVDSTRTPRDPARAPIPNPEIY